MKRLVLAAAIAALTPLAASAHPPGADRCFLTRLLQNHTVGTDGHTMYLGVNGTEVYQVTTGGPCLAHVTGSDPIVVGDFGLGKICHPLDLEVTVRGARCAVDKLTKLTPAEASALPKRLQP